MPFNSKTGREAVEKRWGERPPDSNREVQVNVRMSPSEEKMLNEKAAEANLSRAETVITAIEQFDPKKYRESQI